MSSKKVFKYLISTWPQRFALACLTGFLVWTTSGKDFVIFISSVIASLVIYHVIHLRVRPPKQNVNEEVRIWLAYTVRTIFRWNNSYFIFRLLLKIHSRFYLFINHFFVLIFSNYTIEVLFSIGWIQFPFNSITLICKPIV